MTTYEPLDVKRVQTTSGGSHIEPPLQDTWSEIEKLRWHAGVVLVDSGVRVKRREWRAASSLKAQAWAAWFAAERDWNWHNENCGSICRCDRDWIEP